MFFYHVNDNQKENTKNFFVPLMHLFFACLQEKGNQVWYAVLNAPTKWRERWVLLFRQLNKTLPNISEITNSFSRLVLQKKLKYFNQPDDRVVLLLREKKNFQHSIQWKKVILLSTLRIAMSTNNLLPVNNLFNVRIMDGWLSCYVLLLHNTPLENHKNMRGCVFSTNLRTKRWASSAHIFLHGGRKIEEETFLGWETLKDVTLWCCGWAKTRHHRWSSMDWIILNKNEMGTRAWTSDNGLSTSKSSSCVYVNFFSASGWELIKNIMDAACVLRYLHKKSIYVWFQFRYVTSLWEIDVAEYFLTDGQTRKRIAPFWLLKQDWEQNYYEPNRLCRDLLSIF